ncbi:DUF4360 domain-containing protein [Nocardia sp. NRRL S-836]|uniref:DUF4360 domain-containing protein n=1 Tax=Nocardia sp. NRRL S-836 TaxID=1519492 RepID=UPI0006AE53E9|nr:DUF4360 domain-containing protein [Nocardia sp. NRRL S-836]KOV81746.1 hypothetical protein ADL03_27450 [Nocardia sp. NRRL S-836]
MSGVVVAALVAASLVPPPGAVTIELVSVSGTGCRQGTAVVAMSGDGQAFTVTYSDFAVRAKGTEAKKSCTIEVELRHAQGYTYGIAQTDHRGFAQLTDGARGTQRNSYRFPGYPTRHSTTTYQGPMSDNWQVTDVPDEPQHGPCKDRKPLTVETELKVTGKGSATSLMTLDSTDSSVTTTLRLSWQRCAE